MRDLKAAPAGGLLVEADALITSSRAASLARLGLDPATIRAHPRLCHVAIVGYGPVGVTAANLLVQRLHRRVLG